MSDVPPKRADVIAGLNYVQEVATLPLDLQEAAEDALSSLFDALHDATFAEPATEAQLADVQRCADAVLGSFREHDRGAGSYVGTLLRLAEMVKGGALDRS